jgi:hypothetical protein
MIKKSVFEDDLIRGMEQELLHSDAQKRGYHGLDKAGDYLQAALEVFEESGLKKQAEAVLSILNKIAQQAVTPDEQHAKKHPSNKNLHDPHIPKSTDQAVKGLKEYGIPFVNLSDDGHSDDLLNVEVGNTDLEVAEQPAVHDFEEEVD